MVQYIHIFYTARRRRKQFCFLGGQNGAIYIPVHLLHSPPQAKKFGGFLGQNDAIYIHIWGIFFGVKMLPYIHILGFFLVKMLAYIHILVGFGVKMLPYIYTFGVFFCGQNAAIYTHFWNLIFSEKTKKKKNNTPKDRR